MSNLQTISLYDSSNYECKNFQNLNEFKKYFSQKNYKQFIILDSLGNEYDQETINQIKINENNKRGYIIYYYDRTKKYNLDKKKDDEIDKILLNQFGIDTILTDYLESKKTNLNNANVICDEILRRTEELERNGRIEELIDKYENIFEVDEDFKSYIEMIKACPKQLDKFLPKFKEIIENMESNMNNIFHFFQENEKLIVKGDPNQKALDKKKEILKSNDTILKKKLLNIIKNDKLINFSKQLNEILIYGEKINFLLNLSEIPNIYLNIDQNSLKMEYERRNKFNYLYEQTIHFLHDLIVKELELRKKFIRDTFKLNNKLKMEKKTLHILNKLTDFEAQKNFLAQKELYKSNYQLVDDFKKSIDELVVYLNDLSKKLFSKEKNNVNLDNNNLLEPKINNLNIEKNDINNKKFSEPLEEIEQILRSSSVPTKNEKQIMSIIENKIINPINLQIPKNKSSSSNNELISSENSNDTNIDKIIQFFSDTYGNFLWFYEKVYNYLEIYSQNVHKKNLALNKNDPCSVNQYLIEILNENISLKGKNK